MKLPVITNSKKTFSALFRGSKAAIYTLQKYLPKAAYYLPWNLFQRDVFYDLYIMEIFSLIQWVVDVEESRQKPNIFITWDFPFNICIYFREYQSSVFLSSHKNILKIFDVVFQSEGYFMFATEVGDFKKILITVIKFLFIAK